MNGANHVSAASSRARASSAWLLSLALAAFAFPATASAVNASSAFSANDQGWRIASNGSCDDPTKRPPDFNATGGNPGGRIGETDDETGVVNDECFWSAVAPAGYIGQLRANYGGTISYDLRHPAGADFGGGVGLSDANGNSLEGGFDETAAPTANVWRTYSFTLSEASPGWIYYPADGGDPAPPTRAQFFAMLADVSSLAVGGDLSFDSQGERTDIDNIDLSEPPTPLDTDGDGVVNGSDNCPLEQGPASNGGCPLPPVPPVLPDADGDGVPDSSDACPAQPGPASNGGCPLVTAPPPSSDDSCELAKQKLTKARKKLKLLKRSEASAPSIAKAAKQARKAKGAVKQKCAADGQTMLAPRVGRHPGRFGVESRPRPR
jgi:hypothetical protein